MLWQARDEWSHEGASKRVTQQGNKGASAGASERGLDGWRREGGRGQGREEWSEREQVSEGRGEGKCYGGSKGVRERAHATREIAHKGERVGWAAGGGGRYLLVESTLLSFFMNLLAKQYLRISTLMKLWLASPRVEAT